MVLEKVHLLGDISLCMVRPKQEMVTTWSLEDYTHNFSSAYSFKEIERVKIYTYFLGGGLSSNCVGR